jgi:DNA-binding NtrC family response regulator
MERAVLLSKGGVLMPEHLPRKMFKVKPRSSIASLSESKGDGSGQELFDSVPDKSSLQDMETKMLIDMLLACHGNRSESARKLGISRRTLLYKIKKLEDRGVEVPKPGA